MTTSIDLDQPTLCRSEILVKDHIEALRTTMEAEITATLERYDDLPDLLRAVGLHLDEGIDEDESLALLAIRMGVNALPKVMEAVLGMGLNGSAMTQDATVLHRLEVTRSPERVITDLYELADVPTAKVAAQPGMVEGLKTATGVYTLLGFEDGSGFVQVASTDGNRAFHDAWAAALTDVEEIAEDRRLKIAENFQTAVEPMVSQSNLSPMGLRQVKAMVDGMVLSLMRSLATSTSLLLPATRLQDSAMDVIVASLADKATPDVWRSGITVVIDGAAVATPNALRIALGVAPRASLQESLARLAAATGGTHAG